MSLVFANWSKLELKVHNFCRDVSIPHPMADAVYFLFSLFRDLLRIVSRNFICIVTFFSITQINIGM